MALETPQRAPLKEQSGDESGALEHPVGARVGEPVVGKEVGAKVGWLVGGAVGLHILHVFLHICCVYSATVELELGAHKFRSITLQELCVSSPSTHGKVGEFDGLKLGDRVGTLLG